jgi:hypothetical protein
MRVFQIRAMIWGIRFLKYISTFVIFGFGPDYLFDGLHRTKIDLSYKEFHHAGRKNTPS